MESAKSSEQLKLDILRVKKEYIVAQDLFLANKSLIAYYSQEEIKTRLIDAEKAIQKAQKELSGGKNEIAGMSLHLVEVHLRAVEKKIEGCSKRIVI